MGANIKTNSLLVRIYYQIILIKVSLKAKEFGPYSCIWARYAGELKISSSTRLSADRSITLHSRVYNPFPISSVGVIFT